jgi:hypothetical protein
LATDQPSGFQNPEGNTTVKKVVGRALTTFTTYGTWLRGDSRGWVDDGVVFPADPMLELADAGRMKHDQYRFSIDQLLAVGNAIGISLRDRMKIATLALTVQTWHGHLVVAATKEPIDQVVKCAKDAARYHLRPGRPIWTDGYDKRFCFDIKTLENRIDYVERHNEQLGWPRRPWPWLADI